MSWKRTILQMITIHHIQSDALRFRISVFQQIPGTLLIKGTLHEKESSNSGIITLLEVKEALSQLRISCSNCYFFTISVSTTLQYPFYSLSHGTDAIF